MDKAKVASVERKNFMRIGLGQVALDLYLPRRKQSLTELAWIGRSALVNSLFMDCSSIVKISDFKMKCDFRFHQDFKEAVRDFKGVADL